MDPSPTRKTRWRALLLALLATAGGVAVLPLGRWLAPPTFSGALTLGSSGQALEIRTVTPAAGGRLIVARVPRGVGLTLEAALLAERGSLGSLGQKGDELGALVAINGDYHTLNAPHLPSGPFTGQGVVVTREGAPGYEVSFWVDPQGTPRIGPAETSHAPRLLLGSGPRLLIEGQLPPQLAEVDLPGYTRRLARAAIGLADDAVFLVASTQDAAGGLSLLSLARALEELGCHDGLALDGGPSAALWVRTGWLGGVLSNVPAGQGGAEPALASGLFVLPEGGVPLH